MTRYNNKVYCGTRSINTYCKVLVWDLDTNDGLVDLLSFDASTFGLSGIGGVQDILWHNGDMYCRSMQTGAHAFIVKFTGGVGTPELLLYSKASQPGYGFCFCIHQEKVIFESGHTIRSMGLDGSYEQEIIQLPTNIQARGLYSNNGVLINLYYTDDIHLRLHKFSDIDTPSVFDPDATTPVAVTVHGGPNHRGFYPSFAHYKDGFGISSKWPS